MRPWDPHQKSESNIVFLKLEQLFALVVDQGGPLIGDDHVNDSISAIHHLSWYLCFQMDHPSMSGLDMLGSPHNGVSDSINGAMSSLPMSEGPHGAHSQLSHPSMYSHSSSVSSMMSPHSSLAHPHHPHHQATHVSLPDTDTDPMYKMLEFVG